MPRGQGNGFVHSQRRVHEAAWLESRGRFHHVQRSPHERAVVARHVLNGAARREPFDRHPQAVDLLDVDGRDQPDVHPTARPMIDEALALEQAQRLAHRSLAHTEPACNLHLHEPVPGRSHTTLDLLAERICNVDMKTWTRHRG